MISTKNNPTLIDVVRRVTRSALLGSLLAMAVGCAHSDAPNQAVHSGQTDHEGDRAAEGGHSEPVSEPEPMEATTTPNGLNEEQYRTGSRNLETEARSDDAVADRTRWGATTPDSPALAAEIGPPSATPQGPADLRRAAGYPKKTSSGRARHLPRRMAANATAADVQRGAHVRPPRFRPRPIPHPIPPHEGWRQHNTESYDSIAENRFSSVQNAPLSTFSVDVDTASYSNVRRFLSQGRRPPAGSVRIEELVNYFNYDYENPTGTRPFSVHTEVGPAPWAPSHRLLHIGLQGKRLAAQELPPRNLVFLLDVSGSMGSPNKLPLLKRSFKALLETMGEQDTVSIVVYAGASGVVLPPTSGDRRHVILSALDRLRAGGSTNGSSGIQLAYQMAQQRFTPGGVNRVILATDGDFNVGTTSHGALVDLIEKKRRSGVFLTVLGFGMGNYKDSTLELLADKGNGNYAYIDSYREARKVLVEQAGGTLVTIAKDVKIQVEMNPALVGAYRLIGYENRALQTEDFNDDQKDAGEIGAGHSVTAIYEILTPEQALEAVQVDGLRYQKPSQLTGKTRELATVKLRYKPHNGNQSILAEFPVIYQQSNLARTSEAYRFSAAVAGFGMLLRGSQFAGNASFGSIQRLARGAVGVDREGYRKEFMTLLDRASTLR